MISSFANGIPNSDALKATTARAFNSSLFETFIHRIVRYNLGKLKFEPDHPVLLCEIELIQDATDKLKAHLQATVPEWRLSWRICKVVIIAHLRNLAKDRLDTYDDIDDEEKDFALESINQEDFEKLWPPCWTDA